MTIHDTPSYPEVCYPTVSILMSTYKAESSANLFASLTSLCEQDVTPDQIVLVVDGPIDASQKAMIAQFTDKAIPSRFTVLWLTENVGLAEAMNKGLSLCTSSYTMRMDSDDLCTPDRVRIQLSYLAANPEIDVLSAWAEEFFKDGSPSNMKVSPTTHDAVVRALHWRNVLVHPAVCIKTSTLRKIGGYRSRFGLMEDYDLFIRLAQAGARFHVIPKVLLRIRCGLDQRRRRGGLRYALHEFRFRKEFYRSGFFSLREFIVISCLYAIFRLVSGASRDRFYALARS